MNVRIKDIAIRMVCMTLALHIFNCSVDLPDPESDFTSENLAINDIESVAELILEKGFDLENFVPEQDEPDADNTGLEIKKGLQFFSEQQFECTVAVEFNSCVGNSWDLYTDEHITEIYLQISERPPEA